MGCNNCEEKWRIIQAMQSQNNYIMKKAEKSDEGAKVDENQIEVFQETLVEAPKQVVVQPLGKPDVNKIIEDRRKTIQEGKIIKK